MNLGALLDVKNSSKQPMFARGFWGVCGGRTALLCCSCYCFSCLFAGVGVGNWYGRGMHIPLPFPTWFEAV